MKINNIIQITLCLILIVFLEAGNLKKGSDDVAKPPTPKILDAMQMMIVREEIKRCTKMGTPTSKDTPFDMCFKIMSMQGHMKQLTDFWSLLVSVFMWNSKKPSVSREDILKNFVIIGKDEKMTNGKTCQDIMTDLITDDETLASRARDMRDTISPELPSRPSTPTNLHNWITSFNGVHRYTPESTTLIPKLNDISNRA